MNETTFEGFDWDDGNWPKCGTHGMSRAEIEQVFLNTPAVRPHPVHSQAEERMKAIGTTDEGRHAYVSFTLRPSETGGVLIRPVSARYMHRKEVKKYEQDNQDR